jgi:hypothetical protein
VPGAQRTIACRRPLRRATCSSSGLYRPPPRCVIRCRSRPTSTPLSRWSAPEWRAQVACPYCRRHKGSAHDRGAQSVRRAAPAQPPLVALPVHSPVHLGPAAPTGPAADRQPGRRLRPLHHTALAARGLVRGDHRQVHARRRKAPLLWLRVDLRHQAQTPTVRGPHLPGQATPPADHVCHRRRRGHPRPPALPQPHAEHLLAWLQRWRNRVGDPHPEAAAWADEVIDRHFGTAARRAS